MKRHALLLFLLGIFMTAFAQPTVTNLNFPESAPLFGLYEVGFSLDDYDNHYDPEVIHAYAVFEGPDSQEFIVDAFYYEGYTFERYKVTREVAQRQRDEQGWKVRFTPNAVGEWKFRIEATDRTGSTEVSSFDGRPLTFRCEAVDSAKGFISLANTRFLQREVVEEGQRKERSFFPVGPNIAWYDAVDFGRFAKPYGIYEYCTYIDQMTDAANYMRVWLNRYQYLSLYGPEHTELVDGKLPMYFDRTLNQKDAAELDYIVDYAREHDISIMASVFNFGDFQHNPSVEPPTAAQPAQPGDWINNPFHTVLGLKTNSEFFTNQEAKRIAKNMLRYVVARWGYATNILCWELWNEVANMYDDKDIDQKTQRDIVQWHQEMAAFIRSIDPYHHPITTSLGSTKAELLYEKAFEAMDFVQYHNYQNIQKANSRQQFSAILYRLACEALDVYPSQPYFMGEFGFGQNNPAGQYVEKDPYGIDLHNSLWSSAFSGSMGPASFWYWVYLRKKSLFQVFKPVKTFLDQLPVLSDSFRPMMTGKEAINSMVFPNNLQTYYMVNATEDTLFGWSQDTAFAYQSLRYLSDPLVKNRHFVDKQAVDQNAYVYTLAAERRPKASSRDNTIRIPMDHQPTGTLYEVRWFDGETGLELPEEATTAVVRWDLFKGKHLAITFPESIRNTETLAINNTLGDAAFVIYKVQDDTPKPSKAQNTNTSKKVTFQKGQRNTD